MFLQHDVDSDLDDLIYLQSCSTNQYEVYTQNADSPDVHTFKLSRLKEIQGLVERGVFRVVKPEEIPSGARIFNSRFVDSIKH
jgi:hypothetical protein